MNDKYSNWLRQLHPVWFVLFMLGASYLVVLPIAIFSAIGIIPIGEGSKIMSMSDLHTRLFLGALVAPLLETLIFQYLPIRALRAWTKMSWSMVILTAAASFGYAHTYSLGYIVFAFALGVVFAYAFAIKDEPRQFAFLYVFVIHALRNAVTAFWFPYLD